MLSLIPALILLVSNQVNFLARNTPPTGTLPLPAVGAELGIFGKSEIPVGFVLGKDLKNESTAADVQIKSMTVSKAENKYIPSGLLQVDILLSKPARDHYVDIYVSGYYVGVYGEVEGIKNAGRRPAYEFMRVDYINQNKHPQGDPNRRYQFRIPDVLPIKVRAELYQIKLGKPARFLGMKEAIFDTDFKDYGVVNGYLFGDPKKSITKASFMVLEGTESVNVRIPAMKPIKPDDFSNDVNITIRIGKGETEIRQEMNRNIEGRELNWKATSVSANPTLQDRDIRNNYYWPHLKGAGYLEIPPIKAGNSGITKYP